jgi:hypothetical protein
LPIKQQSPVFSHQASCSILSCTDIGKLIEHIYGFLMIVGRILAKYADKNSDGGRCRRLHYYLYAEKIDIFEPMKFLAV